jgi:phosphate-selective porin OprO/OprP
MKTFVPRNNQMGYVLPAFIITATWNVPVSAQDLSVNFGGRYMVDYTFADLTDEDIVIRSGDIRRLRAGLSGDIGNSLEYEAEIDIDGGDVGFTDLKLEYAPKGTNWSIVAGQQRITTSLDEQTSSRFSSTLERAAFTDAFDFQRRLGVVVAHNGERHHISGGIFSSDINGRQGGSLDKGKAASARAVYNPVKSDDTVIHVGASWRYRHKGDDNSDIQYEQKPYSRNAPDDILDSGRFSKSDNFFGVELAALQGPLWVADEAAILSANGSGDQPDAMFDAGYVELGYFIGGQRSYRGDGFSRPDIDKTFLKGGLGGLACVIRLDTLDLQDNLYAGKLDTLIIGMDWWPSDRLRFGANYFYINAENAASESGKGILLRAQLDI